MNKLIIYILVSSFFIFTQQGIAEEIPISSLPNNVTFVDNPVLVAEVNIYDAKLLSSEKNTFRLSFDLSNKRMVQPDIKYAVELTKKNDKEETILVDRHIYSEIINLGENQTLKKEIEYTAPAYLVGKYDLWIVASNLNGLSLGLANLGQIVMAGNNQYVEIMSDSCYLEVEGDKGQSFAISQGVDIDANETLIATCLYHNHFTTGQNIFSNFKILYRTGFGKEVETLGNNPQTIYVGANEVGKFSLIIPRVKIPQAYEAMLVFKNHQEYIISNAVNFHFVLRGEGATIQNIRLDKDRYQNGETAKVSLLWSGSADNFPYSRHDQTKPSLLKFRIRIQGADGKECIKPTEIKLDPKAIYGDFDFLITDNCVDPIVLSSIVNDKNTTIDIKEYFLTSEPEKTQIEKKEIIIASKINKIIVYIIIAVLIAILLTTIFIVKRKHIKILIFFVLVLVSFFFGGNTAKADTYTASYKSSAFYVTLWWPHSVTLTYNLNKLIYTTNELITANVRVSSYTCDNSLLDYWLNIDLVGTSFPLNVPSNTTPIHSYSKNASNIPTVDRAWFYYRDNRCYLGEGTCSYNDGIYLVNKMQRLNSVPADRAASPNPGLPTSIGYWEEAELKPVLEAACGTVFNHYTMYGKTGCTVGPCENIPGCKAQCAPNPDNPWFMVNIPYQVINATVNGQCGTKQGSYTYIDTQWPVGSTYCTTGTQDSSPAFPLAGSLVGWWCNGSGGGNNTYCTATRSATPINGSCGTLATSYASSITNWPGGTFCSAGNTSPVSPIFPAIPGNTVNWQCISVNGGNTANCSATRNLPPPVNGQCGTRNTSYMLPTTTWPVSSQYCQAGAASVSPSFPAYGQTVNWKCLGIDAGSDANCSATLITKVNGACGSANNTQVFSEPSSNLCAYGIVDSMWRNDDFYWTWNCKGIDGGTDANCKTIGMRKSKLHGYKNNIAENFVAEITCTSKYKVQTSAGLECLALTANSSDPNASSFAIVYTDGSFGLKYLLKTPN